MWLPYAPYFNALKFETIIYGGRELNYLISSPVWSLKTTFFSNENCSLISYSEGERHTIHYFDGHVTLLTVLCKFHIFADIMWKIIPYNCYKYFASFFIKMHLYLYLKSIQLFWKNSVSLHLMQFKIRNYEWPLFIQWNGLLNTGHAKQTVW